MENKENLLPKKVSILDKIINKIKGLGGYKPGEKFTLNTKPYIRTYSFIEQSKIADKEYKLLQVIDKNKNSDKLVDGIKTKDAETLLEWVVQNAREGLKGDEDIYEDSLQGCCGLGQAITGFTLKNMGLDPNICNARECFDGSAGHGFVTVKMPIKQDDGTLSEKRYLVDATYRQFFLRESGGVVNEFIKDKRYGNKVVANAGYYTLQMDGGEEFADELLSEGYIELTEENAKIYGDSFVLAGRNRKDNTKIPTREELQTGFTGADYIRITENKELQKEIDYSEQELKQRYIDTRTPLMKRNRMSNVLDNSNLKSLTNDLIEEKIEKVKEEKSEKEDEQR